MEEIENHYWINSLQNKIKSWLLNLSNKFKIPRNKQKAIYKIPKMKKYWTFQDINEAIVNIFWTICLIILKRKIERIRQRK